MTEIFINGKNAFQNFGVRLIRGGIEALLTPGTNKDYVTNDSRLNNGTDYQTGIVRKREREVTLSFLVEGDSHTAYLNNYENFLNEINGAFSLRVVAKDIVISGDDTLLQYTKFDRTFHLVYSSCSKYGDYGLKKGIFALRFIEPDPTNRIKGNEVI